MSQENIELARSAVAAFNRRDVPALVEMTTDDFEWVTWTGTVEPTVYEGSDGLAAYFKDADVWSESWRGCSASGRRRRPSTP